MSNNEIKQKITLDASEHISTLNKVNANVKSAMTDMSNALTGNSKTVAQNEAQIKQWGKSATDALEKYSKEMKSNLALGTKALTLDLGRDAIKQSAKDAISMAFSFSKAFAEIKSRSNASESDLQRWRKSIMKISADTTANMDSMAESFKDMFSSVKNPQELLKIMNSIGQAAAMGDGDATKVSGFVMSTLQGQGREVNTGNVNDVLGASDILRRNGKGFGNIQDAMGAMGSISGQDLAKSKLSERDLASILAGATRSGSEKGAAIKGIGDLISSSNNGLMEGSVLASVLGTNKLTDKSGKFDITKLGGKGSYQKLLGYGGGDENKAREVFAKISGLSAESSNAIFNMVKNFKALNETVQASEKDQKAFSKSAEEAKDNLMNSYSGFKNTLIAGVSDILGGFEKPLKELMKGNLGGAVSGAGSAINQALGGIMDNKMLVAGSIATVFGGGALIKSLLSSATGGKVGGLAAGVGMGAALKNMGVEPVYVVNASEIGKEFSLTKNGIADILGVGGAAAGAGAAGGASKLGFLARMAAFAGTASATGVGALATGGAAGLATLAGGVGVAGAAGYGVGSLLNDHTPLGGIGEWAYDKMNPEPQKVIVEIHSKDPAFMAIPKGSDNARDGKVH
jgi:hypothetical protein